uniref:Piwi domain-containing protein n=1 Tax=Globodera pallida TaxID=36090 RepID=A0A183BQ53_GLOPA
MEENKQEEPLEITSVGVKADSEAKASLKKKKKAIAEPSKDFRIKEEGLCSMFLIKVEEGRKAYRYDIEVTNLVKLKSLTRGSDDGLRAFNRKICYELLIIAYEKTGQFGMKPDEQGNVGEIVYDSKATLYSSMPFCLADPKIEVAHDEIVDDYVKSHTLNDGFLITITPNQQKPVLDISDYCQYYSKKSLFDEDRTVRTFLEMCISQFSINRDIYTPIGAGKLYEVTPEEQISVGNGVVLRSGVAKGVRIVRNYGNLAPALVLDIKVSPFYEPNGLVPTIFAIMNNRMPQMGDWIHIRKALVDVRVNVMYAKHRSFGIGRFTDQPMSKLIVKWQGKRVSMPEYFVMRYGITIDFPDFPAIVPNTPVPRGRPVETFPIEQLIIMEDQRVPLEKMDSGLSGKLLKANTVPPDERLDKIMQCAFKMSVFNETNPVLRAFGITVDQTSNRIVIGVRSSPRILYAKNQIINPSPDNTEWTKLGVQAQYLQTNELMNWIMLTDERHLRGDKDTKDGLVKAFASKLIDKARKRGLELTNPHFIVFSRSGIQGWMEMLERCLNSNIEFIMLIDYKSEDTHGLLKYYEARYHMPTQHVSVEKVIEVVKRGKTQTLENIINKLNCKNFGLNYMPLVERSAERFALEKGKVLVIGYDVAHPAPTTPQERRMLHVKGATCDSFDPSIVGICANVAFHPHNFVGDYFYQQSRKESVDVTQLAERTTGILQMLEANRPAHARPKYIIVLRDGLSEAQFAMAIEEEMSALKMGCMDYDDSYKPKFMFVKFFMVHDNTVVNLTPGSVINEKMVRPDIPEFFMQSHFPKKGTGKPVEYSVLVDEIGMTQDELQGFLNALCYSHQIISFAISLPEPIWQADELAKRGRNNYLTMKRFFPRDIPRLPSGVVDTKLLTDGLCYRNGRLSATRFTA